jgi:riboflavin kinase/FMN adenylyltransferase
MQILHTLEPPTGEARPLVVAAGCFDGVHVGHQAVVRTAVEQARALGGEAWVLTFDPHPAKVLNPNTAPPLLSAWPVTFRCLAQQGADGMFKVPFTRAFAARTPDEFLDAVHCSLPTLKAFVVGEDWTFGHRGSGRLTQLRAWGRQSGVGVIAVSPVLLDGRRVSSTWIRHAVLAGELDVAERLLGRPFSLYGRVIEGRGVGRTLGYPTANLEVENEVHPPPGIYAARARIERRELPAAAYLGSRRTFHNIGSEQVLEVHLLEQGGDLYGLPVEVSFVAKVREDLRFESVEALKARIRNDLEVVRGMLENN